MLEAFFFDMHLKSKVKNERNCKKFDSNYWGNIRRNRYISFRVLLWCMSTDFEAYLGQLHLKLWYSRVAVPFNTTYSPPTFIFKSYPVSELRHAHCCVSSDQSNSRSCVGPTRVEVKVQGRYLPYSARTRVTIVRTLVPDEVTPRHTCTMSGLTTIIRNYASMLQLM